MGERESAVDKKNMEISDAEERTVRLDTFLNDIQGSLETVHSQNVMVDAGLEKAGQMIFQAKEAEALITAFREERDVAARVN